MSSSTFLPEYVQYGVCFILLLCSSMFSGLILGLMTLDLLRLKIVSEAGLEPQRTYARKILPIRKHGNLLLCTLIVGLWVFRMSMLMMK